jgi:bifunctional N-acetylglucosamine-1-phosphate-uridyltransferase/glucosamine-1-phosphate-acetyltransferase GlmU-like protein
MEQLISKKSEIHPDAKIGENVIIEAFAKIDKDVVIGDGTWIVLNLMENTVPLKWASVPPFVNMLPLTGVPLQKALPKLVMIPY